MTIISPPAPVSTRTLISSTFIGEFMNQIINNESAGVDYINRLYLWVLLTYDRIYGLNRPMTYYFNEPYASQGKGVSINVSLNKVFTDSFKQAINTGTDKAFMAAVQDNDIHDWKPKTRTQLYHGDADEIVLYLNSLNTYHAMQKRGATNVELGGHPCYGYSGVHYRYLRFLLLNTVRWQGRVIER
jgi:hypothetical protein